MNIVNAIAGLFFAALLFVGFGNNIIAGLQAQAHGVTTHQEAMQ